MKPKYFFLLLTGLFLLSFIVNGQSRSYIVKGTVYQQTSMDKLLGVNVYLKGSTTGTVTNQEGFYSIKLPEGNADIVYSFIGYKIQEREVMVSADKVLNIYLEADDELLGEVQITSQRKFFGNLDYGRELPSIDSKVIAKQNSSNASDILHASISGVWATSHLH